MNKDHKVGFQSIMHDGLIDIREVLDISHRQPIVGLLRHEHIFESITKDQQATVSKQQEGKSWRKIRAEGTSQGRQMKCQLFASLRKEQSS